MLAEEQRRNKQFNTQTPLAGKCLAGSPHRLVTDGQTDRRTVALDYADGLVTDGQTDRQTYRGVTDVKTALFA